jgi:hypothetical protein
MDESSWEVHAFQRLETDKTFFVQEHETAAHFRRLSAAVA